MSAVILQMVLRKRAASAQAGAARAERDAIVAQAKGEPGLTWRGEWQKDANYLTSDAVSNGGSSWIATAPSNGERPKKGSAVWDLLALKGADGKKGKDSRSGTTLIAGGGSELAALELTGVGSPQSIAVKINGQWVQMGWSAFLGLLPATGGVPVNAVTVNGEYVTVTE